MGEKYMPASLSIIIPAYNAAEYIEECVESVISGTCRELEVLLIDDGSTDRTGHLCDCLAEKYSAVQVFHTDNQGIAEARNLGIDHASGQYIGFVDADDTVTPNMFDEMINCMSSDIQLVVCRYHRCKENDKGLVDEPTNSKVLVNQAGTVERLLKNEYGAFVWNKLFRKEILEAEHIRFPKNSRSMEDLFFTWTYVKHCDKAVFIEDSLYFYVMHSNSIMNAFRQKRIVANHYVSLPRGWRFCAETVEKLAPELKNEPKARTVMFYQTVLRKIEKPETEYIEEATAYVKQNKFILCHYLWGWKYFPSAVMLSISYPLWSSIFRRGIAERQ